MISTPAQRLKWIELYQKLGHLGKVCQHFGMSRATLNKWIKRYKELGKEGLIDLSSKPKFFPSQKRNEANELLIITLRKKRKLGARRLQSELKRLHHISFSLSTIHKVLKKYAVAPLTYKRLYRKRVKRYTCKVPGQRLQMDVCQITKGLYQYTAIDDCTRYKIIYLYSRRTAKNTLHFLDILKENFPFPYQRIQTDRGQEFFAYEVQDYLKEQKIKFRPIKPFSPHLNGKVERTQRTDLDEFYSSVDSKDPHLLEKLLQWQAYYNTERPHSSLEGKTPWEKFKELEHLIPSVADIQLAYDDSKEDITLRNYKYDQVIKLLKNRRNIHAI